MGKQPFVRDRISQGDIFLGKFPCIRQKEQKTCNGGTWSRLMAIFFVYSSGCLTVNELPGSSWFHKTDGPVFTPAQGFLSTQLWIFRNEMLYYLIKSRGKQISIQETAVAAQSVYICSSLFQRLHSNFLVWEISIVGLNCFDMKTFCKMTTIPTLSTPLLWPIRSFQCLSCSILQVRHSSSFIMSFPLSFDRILSLFYGIQFLYFFVLTSIGWISK